MSTDTDWRPFGLDKDDYPAPDERGTRVINISGRRWGRKNRQDRGPKDRAGTWLRNAMIALALLAGVAAVVSYSAQYWLVYSFKHSTAIAALQAGIPDTGALVFAALGISLALQGRRAIRPRALNVLCVGISIAMNALAASAGWRALAVWTMAPVLYALASDTLIGVIRAYAIRQQRQLREDLADDETTPLAILGGLFLWLLRLTLAPASTLTGFRRWVVDTCPVAPGRRVLPASPIVAALAAAPEPPASAAISTSQRRPRGPRSESKRAQLIKAYEDLAEGGDPRYGDRSKASQVAKELAALVGMQWGGARTALYRHIDSKAGA